MESFSITKATHTHTQLNYGTIVTHVHNATPEKATYVDIFPMPPKSIRDELEWQAFELIVVGNAAYNAPADILCHITSFDTKLAYVEILDCDANYEAKGSYEKRQTRTVMKRVSDKPPLASSLQASHLDT